MAISGYLQDAKNQQEKLATNLTAKGVVASATEKYNSLVSKVAQIEELRGEERTLDVMTKYNDIPESIVSIKYPETKNLFVVGKVEDYIYLTESVAINLTIENNNISGLISPYSTSSILNTKHNLKSGTYTFSSTNTTSDGSDSEYRYLVRFYDNSGNIITDLKITNWKYNQYYKAYFTDFQKQTIIIPNTVSYWQYGLAFVGTTGATSTYSNIQLELGTTATAYEPYGIDKKIDLQLSSKNLFDLSSALQASNWETFSYGYYTYALTGLKPNTSYTVSMSENGWSGETNNGFYVSIQDKKSEWSESGSLCHGTGAASYCPKIKTVISNADGMLYLAFYSVTQARLSEFFEKCPNFQLELGSTATPYTPYISDLTSVNVTACGKNLFDINNPQTFYYGYNISRKLKIENGIIYSAGVAGDTEGQGLYIRNPKKTITISFNVSYESTETTRTVTIRGFNSLDSSGVATTSSIEVKTNITSPTTITITNTEFEYIGITWFSNTQYGLEITNLQIEKGSTATPYEPYQGTTYTPTSDGIVTGIQNIYPLTNIFTDNTGALITAYQETKGNAYFDILPSTGKNGIIKVRQAIVDSSVDSNIKAENIKKDVNILGVTGSYEGAPAEVEYTYDTADYAVTIIF